MQCIVWLYHNFRICISNFKSKFLWSKNTKIRVLTMFFFQKRPQVSLRVKKFIEKQFWGSLAKKLRTPASTNRICTTSIIFLLIMPFMWSVTFVCSTITQWNWVTNLFNDSNILHWKKTRLHFIGSQRRNVFSRFAKTRIKDFCRWVIICQNDWNQM